MLLYWAEVENGTHSLSSSRGVVDIFSIEVAISFILFFFIHLTDLLILTGHLKTAYRDPNSFPIEKRAADSGARFDRFQRMRAGKRGMMLIMMRAGELAKLVVMVVMTIVIIIRCG